jgi:hypothetical protein
MKCELCGTHEASRLTLREAEHVVSLRSGKRYRAKTWAGRCHEIAIYLAPHVGGKPQYGHYIGPIDRGSDLFADRADIGWTRHGWIARADGTVLDPTRWAFEDARPYIYEGKADDYDAGGNKLRATLLRPPPHLELALDNKGHADTSQVRTVLLALEVDAAAWVERLLQNFPYALPGAVSTQQAFWLANLPLPRFGGYAAEVYRALEQAGFTGFIPIDNRRAILGP